MRELCVEYDLFGWSAGSVLLSCGNTKILCAVTLQNGVPSFLRGKGTGWLTAEYAMLPASTAVRTQREASTMRRNGRSIEISRLIGRVLRSVVNTDILGERTLVVDCDVLQADGGTRAASITAASLVLRRVQERMLCEETIDAPFLRDDICAVSVGVGVDNSVILDPDYQEDRDLNADFNFIMSLSGDIVELQGGAEKSPVSWKTFEQARSFALEGVKTIETFFGPRPEIPSTGGRGMPLGDRITFPRAASEKQSGPTT